MWEENTKKYKFITLKTWEITLQIKCIGDFIKQELIYNDLIFLLWFWNFKIKHFHYYDFLKLVLLNLISFYHSTHGWYKKWSRELGIKE